MLNFSFGSFVISFYFCAEISSFHSLLLLQLSPLDDFLSCLLSVALKAGKDQLQGA